MNEENCVQKIFLHYTDIVIFVLGHFIVTHPVCMESCMVLTITPKGSKNPSFTLYF